MLELFTAFKVIETFSQNKTKEGFNFNENRNTVTSTKEEKKFIKKCPDSVCRGFLSSAWKCGICNEFFCPDCHVKKNSRIDEEHI